MKELRQHIIRLFTLLLLLGSAVNQAWAYKVTYHILTKPIDNEIYHMRNDFSGKRLEAVRVVDANATSETTIELPAAFKSPLAENFRYYDYASGKVTKSGTAVAMYAYSDKNKAYYYTILDGATDIAGNTVSANMDVYVIYDYKTDNTIYKLDGSKDYNLSMSGGFLAFNRGRNNRIAIIPESANRVNAEALASDDFVKIDVSSIPGTSINPYWKDNKNPKDYVGGQFHFKFQLVGEDPYNILIRTAYNKNYTYIEQHGTGENYLRYKYYKGSYLFWPSSDTSGFFLASDDHKQYTDKSTGYDPNPKASISSETITGYFHNKGEDVVYNSFALLNNTDENGYLFMISRYVNKDGNISDPGDYNNAKYNFLARDGNYNNLKSESKTLAAASASYSTDPETYLVNSYRFKVKRKCSTAALEEDKVLHADVQVSEYYASSSPLDFVPDALKRKYVTFTGAYKQYEGENLVTEFNTFAEVDANAVIEDGKKVIWLDYETDMPFDTWTAAGSDADSDGAVDFDELKWYNFNVNKSTRNSAYWDGSKIMTSRDKSKYARASHFAFVGDPFDLTIVGRKASEDGSGNPSTLNYMKLDATIGNNTAFAASGTTWGIVYDDDTNDNKDCFRLKDNSGDKYLHQNSTTDNPLNGTESSDEAVRIAVTELPQKSYIYYIMRSDGSIAAMSSGRHEPSAKLSYNTIPASIRSPFINGRTLTFYGSYTGSDGGTNAKTDATSEANAITYAKDTENGELQYIVVRYTFPSEGNPYYNYINNATYNVRLNGQFIYYDDGTIKSKASPTTEELATSAYQWVLGGQDPYAMTIKQSSANKFVTVGSWPTGDEEGTGTDITWSDSEPSSKFIIKYSTDEHSYEVMGATGEAYDAMEESFNIGRPSDNTVKVYSDLKYLSGGDVLRFELIPTSAVSVTYHLVDIKNNTELLSVQTRQASTSTPNFPPDYRSPLVDTYTYWSSLSDAQSKTGDHPSSVASGNIYVTYTANNLVDMSGRTLYLMKFALGEQFLQEDGSDGLLDPISEFTGTTEEKKYRYQAVYPYCNGDGNFFVYGQEQYDLQQQSAASTRTRWAWYVESASNDPYHVKISSRQQETYPENSGNDHNSYFRTYAVPFNNTKQVVTNLTWPGISGVQGTEYMVLGSAGQFRLVTSDAIAIDLNGDSDTTDDGENVRHTVNSFEQYWKTWNTIRKIVLGDKNAVAKQSDPNTVPATPAAPTAAEAGTDNRTYLTTNMGWHSYENWAYAIRWNDFNKAGDKNKKGWESIEHWYQTVNMGEGYFDFVPTVIEPVLILLDQHGWEIMRKPLPTGPDDPEKAAKYDAIRAYDSPMVKEYAFWSTAKKRMGFHQYYLLSARVGGDDFTSTSLTDLPPYDSKNVKDTKGNLLDQYVTYIVKEEYAQTYNPSGNTGQPFLIEQGNYFAYNNSDATAIGKYDVPTTGGMSQYIIDNISTLTTSGSKNNELWYLKPNADIDIEMGYQHATKFPGGYAHNWDAKTPNAYEDSKYSTLKAAVYVKKTDEYKNADAAGKKALTDKFGEFSFSNGFDPYNIQISSVSNTAKYFVTDATKAETDEGAITGDGENNTLGAQKAVQTALVGGMDNRTLQMTNATFMAVLGTAGNMQLMPRFDQHRRLKDFSTLVYPEDGEKAKTYTKLYRPLVYTYKIIDNDGNESLRYQSGGDLVPQTPDWFKSPLAKDFEYYKNLTLEEGVYTEIKDETDISAKKITESLEGAAPTDNTVYVRYNYNDADDDLSILKGRWFTMQLNAKDAKYDSGIKKGEDKPSTIDKDQKVWQWKLLKTQKSVPDPYAVQLFNRSVVDAEQPTDTRYAILSHTSGHYALAQAGLGSYTYKFLNGSGMNTTTNASLAEDKDGDNPSGFTSTSCTFHGTDSQVKLINDVSRTFNYRIYTNSGIEAVRADQHNVSEDNTPTLPEEIRSPMLNTDQFIYYGAEADIGNAEKKLENLYGLYDDIVYVRYTDYDIKTTEYKVPNVKAVVNSNVARDESSNDAALDLDGELIYNIIWYDDNMMRSTDNTNITDGGSLEGDGLSGDAAYVWQFEGNDPYAIKIKHKNSGKYAVGSYTLETVAANASPSKTFMLLPSSDDWEYGVLQVTGATGADAGKKLTDYGETLTANASTTPTPFIIFGLSTHKVIYHLVIANIGSYVDIPYSEKNADGTWKEGYSPSNNQTKRILGTTQRDLTSENDGGGTHYPGEKYQLGETINGLTYCVDNGHITLGDPLKVPDALKRPNCRYYYYVEGIYTNEDCDRSSHVDPLDNQYRGLQIDQMDTNPGLLGKVVRINIAYGFDGSLDTNVGEGFVTDVANDKAWYTIETKNGETPWLAQYTNAWGAEVKSGRVTHYTNDYLWSPLGDPYGFQFYNRYIYKNSGNDNTGETDQVLTTTAFAESQQLVKDINTDANSVYELLNKTASATSEDGYFFMHPVVNYTGTQYYLKTVNENDGSVSVKLSATPTPFTFGLNEDLFDPYFRYVGYIGALQSEVASSTDFGPTNINVNAITTAIKNGTPLTVNQLMQAQQIVYDDANLEPFATGYYRLHSPAGLEGISPIRYASGYTHKTELTNAIPMHFYEKEGVSTTFEAVGSGFTKTLATQGQIPIDAPEYDPASIFYITGSNNTNVKISTQGLYVKGATAPDLAEGDGVRAKAYMTATEGEASPLWMMDIGGGVFLIHDRTVPANRKYLSYDQTDADHIYDLKLTHNTHTDYAKWCLQPANNLGLRIETHSGGEEEVLTDVWYYSSYCVPFDMLIANKDGDDKDHSSNAYTCTPEDSPWTTTMLHPRPIGKYNTGTYKDNDYFVPAGTPVLFSTKRATEYIKATIPTTSPSKPISTIFSAKYLEQLLTGWNNESRVYVFGPKMEGTMNINESTGEVTAVQSSLGNTNVGFHINANQNKETALISTSWTRNNYYVLHNKIYYKSDTSGSSARGMTRSGIDFVPVCFDWEEFEEGGYGQMEEEELTERREYVGDGCVYDMQGRRVANAEQVLDGTWKQRVAPGIYIINGKKVSIR